MDRTADEVACVIQFGSANLSKYFPEQTFSSFAIRTRDLRQEAEVRVQHVPGISATATSMTADLRRAAPVPATSKQGGGRISGCLHTKEKGTMPLGCFALLDQRQEGID